MDIKRFKDGKFAPIHGQSSQETKEYRAWVSMKQRCTNPNDQGYCNYGDRGITVCPEWMESFEAFYNHIGPCPEPSLSLDRIDTNKGYEPGNVRWTDKTTQSINRRKPKNNTSGYKGVSLTKWGTWLARISIKGKRKVLGSFKTFEEAVQVRKQAEEKYYDN